MKIFTDKKIIKKIIIAIIIVTIINFISPTISSAVTVDEAGGKLFQPICSFLCYIADLVLEGLQKFFVGDDFVHNISNFSVYTIQPNIKYSPGVIFSGKVPSLDINFFNPSADSQILKKKEVVHAVSYSFDTVVENAIIPLLENSGSIKIDPEIESIINEIYNDIGILTPNTDYPSADNNLVEVSYYTIDGVEYELYESGIASDYVVDFLPKNINKSADYCTREYDNSYDYFIGEYGAFSYFYKFYWGAKYEYKVTVKDGDDYYAIKHADLESQKNNFKSKLKEYMSRKVCRKFSRSNRIKKFICGAKR